MITAGLDYLLANTASLTNVVGPRIFALVIPEETLMPALRYEVVASKGTASFTTPGMQRTWFQFDCYGQDYGSADALRDAVKQLLTGYTGVLQNGIWLQGTEFINQIDLYEQQSQQFRLTVDFYLYYVEPQPQ